MARILEWNPRQLDEWAHEAVTGRYFRAGKPRHSLLVRDWSEVRRDQASIHIKAATHL
jgi:hypothetical protein